MNAFIGAALLAVLLAIYFGIRAVGIILQSVSRLGNSRQFLNMRPDQQMHAFFQAPAGNPRFRRFLNRFFGSFAVAMALLALGLPSIAQHGASVSPQPLFILAGIAGLMAAGGTWAARHSPPGIGAFCQCAACGRELQITGMPQAGGVMMSRDEMWSGTGTAEQCRECGRIYCDPCYLRRGHRCECGRGQDKVRYEFGARYRGSMRLVKVQYQ
jgi:hypothetical protein